MALTSVTRFPGGLSNLSVDAGLADLRKPFEGLYITSFDDFMGYTAANYTVTGTGSVAQVAGADGGRINIISSAGGEQAIQPVLFSFNIAAGQDFFFQARAMIDDATLSGFFIGLSVADTSPYATAPTDGIFFRKTAGSANASVTLRSGSVDIATVLLANPLVAGVMYDFTIAYTPQDGALRATVSGGIGAARLTPASPMPVGAMATNISSFGAAARTLTADYVYVAKAR